MKSTKSTPSIKRKYEYRVTIPMLPDNATSPIMNFTQMEWWLNDMDCKGWEFVGYGQKHWHDAPLQSWWIFRRPITK